MTTARISSISASMYKNRGGELRFFLPLFYMITWPEFLLALPSLNRRMSTLRLRVAFFYSIAGCHFWSLSLMKKLSYLIHNVGWCSYALAAICYNPCAWSSRGCWSYKDESRMPTSRYRVAVIYSIGGCRWWMHQDKSAFIKKLVVSNPMKPCHESGKNEIMFNIVSPPRA